MAPYAVSGQTYWRSGGAKQQAVLCRALPAAFEAVNLKMYPPRVVFDNETDSASTLITVDSANKQGCLLEVVQLLTDLDLVISKARISSDGGWFVDVFHVTDQNGAKVSDPKMVSYIQETLGAGKSTPVPTEVHTCTGRTAWDIDSLRLKHHGIELSGTDRAGLLHDLSSEIAAMGCSVLAAEVWTHNGRVAFVIYATQASGAPLTDTASLGFLKERLKSVMSADSSADTSPMVKITDGKTHASRRMHQMMFADRDFDGDSALDTEATFMDSFLRPSITVRNSEELGYSVVNVKCADRPKLLFDTVCTLTDMQYIIHHATIESDNGLAMQEYFLRCWDGGLLESEAERDRVVKCLQAAIQRHTPSGDCLELCTSDRVGLLADVTRIFKEWGISIAAATVSTRGGKAVNEFYVVGRNGEPLDRRVLAGVQEQVGPGLTIRSPHTSTPGSPCREETLVPFSFTNLLRAQSERFLASFGLSSSPQAPSSLP